MPIIKHIPIYAAPKRMLAYVTNEEKTENTLVTGLNCSENYNDAYEDMKFNFEMIWFFFSIAFSPIYSNFPGEIYTQ